MFYVFFSFPFFNLLSVLYFLVDLFSFSFYFSVDKFIHFNPRLFFFSFLVLFVLFF